MTEEKKDLTGILDLTKASQASISHQAGKDVSPVMEEQKVEQIDSFESFDEFQKSGLNIAENSETVSSKAPSESVPPNDLAPVDLPPSESDEPPASPVSEISGIDTSASVAPTPSTDLPPLTGTDLGSVPGMSADFNAPPTTPIESSTSFTPNTTQKISTGSTTESQLYPNPPSAFGDSPSPTQILQTQVNSLAAVKERSEGGSLMRGQTLRPFDFTMTGFLDPLMQSKFKDIVTKNKLGVENADLEIQFKSGKIKLPRISEFAGVYLIQAFRDAKVDMRLVPVTDTDISQSHTEPFVSSFTHEASAQLTSSQAEQIPITAGEILPEYKDWEIVDTLTSSIGLTSEAIEVEATDLYAEAIESLKREMRLRAFHKGASAIILFSVSMVRLSLPTHYKIFAVGTAINRIGIV